MNKFIIVGHPQSGYQEVEALLLQCGMRTPKPSRRERLTPTEIGDVLCRVYNCPSPKEINSKNDVYQIKVAPIWHGMALDLMLANVDQPFWGWSDPNAIYLLDYWKGLDPSIKFIFVYDDLTKVLTDTVKTESPSDNMDNWCAFNASILHFHYRNLDRSILIHAHQAKDSVNSYLEQLRTRLGAPVNELPAKPAHTPEDIRMPQTMQLNGITGVQDDTGALEKLLSRLLAKQKPEVDQLYEELQSAANLPLIQTESVEYSLQLAWTDLLAQKQRLLQTESALQKMTKNNGEMKQENELLLAQLHQVQDELERYYHENRRLKSNQSQDKKKLYGASDRIKHQLSYRLGATIIEHSKSFKGLITMIWALVETVRVYKIEHRELLSRKLPPISEYADAHLAKRIKQQLSYKLGRTILSNAKSPLGWFRMPFALRREVKDFRARQINQNHK